MILIVDDHLDTGAALARLLKKKCGQEVVAVGSGQAALAVVETARPSLIVLDMMMPGMHGLEVLRRIRAGAAGKDVPVIVYSADDSPETARQALEQGAQEFVIKGSVGWDQLCGVILKHSPG